MLSAVKISDLPLHPKSTDPDFIDLDHIIPVLGKSGGVWTTYRAPLSAAVPAINITATATPVNSFDPATVNVVPGAYRNSYELDFQIPQGQLPSLTGVTIVAVASGDPMANKAIVTPVPPTGFDIQFYLPPGPGGPQGTQGVGINFQGRRSSYAQLANLTLTPSPCLGDAWFVDVDETQTPPASGVFYMRGKDTTGTETWLSGGPLIGPQGPKGDSGFAAAFNNPVTTTLAAGASATVTKATLPDNSVTLTFGIPQGLSGVSPTLNVGTATSLSAGSSPTVTNAGTPTNAVFNFGIPMGYSPTVSISTVSFLSAGSLPFVTNTGVPSAAAFNFGIPAGATPRITIGPVVSALSAGSAPIVTNTGVPSAAVFNFGIPMGLTPTVLVGAVSALNAGAAPIVTTTTSTNNLSSTLSFGIPVGRAATVALATPPAVSATFTAQPSVFNTGSLSAAVFQFAIPVGAPGDWTSPQTIVPVTSGTTYAVAASSVGKILTMSHAGGTVVQIPTGLTVGTKIDIIRMSDGAVSVAPGAGTPSVVGTPSLILRAKYSAVSVICVAANSYVVVGDLQ